MGSLSNEPVLEGLVTEAWDPADAELDRRTTGELVSLMNDADATVPAAVARAHGALVPTIDAVVAAFACGGRLVYVGAGTSGRLALADAMEVRATFGIAPERMLALVAGGVNVDSAPQEHAEDDAEAGGRSVRELAIGPADVVVGISASGRTPYVLAALDEARQAGATTVSVVCVEESELGALADHEVVVVVGGELLAGSTRLKAGTAQKLVLNTISTVAMIKLGKTFGNLMVDVVATNDKLRARVRRIVGLASGASSERVESALDAAGGDARVAIVMLRAELDASAARARLDDASGVLREALES
jgi:N-acetylmuramic acid 6-phosphate etherase